MEKVVDLVKSVIKKFDCEIESEEQWEDEENLIILETGALIITREKERDIQLSFSLANSYLDDAANLAIAFSKLKKVHLGIYSSYIFNEDGEYVDGEEAESIYNMETMKIALLTAKEQQLKAMEN